MPNNPAQEVETTQEIDEDGIEVVGQEPTFTDPAPVVPDDPAPAESTEPESTAPESTEPAAEATGAAAEKETVDKVPDVSAADIMKEIEKLNRRYGYLQRQLEKKEPAAPAAEPAETDPKTLPEGVPPRPKEDDFENYSDYMEALTDWKVDAKLAEQGAHKPAEPGPEGEEESPEDQEFKERLRKGEKLYDDFVQAISDPTVPLTHQMVELLKEIDRPAEVAYFLAKNRDECQKIAGMTPTRAAVALSKIEANLPAAPAPDPGAQPDAGEPQPEPTKPTKTVSTAPEPIVPSSGAVKIEKDPNNMSQAEFEKWYNDTYGR